MSTRSFYDLFCTLPDARTPEGKRYHQAGLLTLVVLARIAQQHSVRQIAVGVRAVAPSLGARRFCFGCGTRTGTASTKCTGCVTLCLAKRPRLVRCSVSCWRSVRMNRL